MKQSSRLKCRQKKKSKKSNNQSFWPSRTCAIVGDSMTNGIHEKPLSQKHDNVNVFRFSGERIEDTNIA